jgi:hypothetical protein
MNEIRLTIDALRRHLIDGFASRIPGYINNRSKESCIRTVSGAI